MKILTILGTRPEIIKLFSLIHEFEKNNEVDHILVHTGQHYDFKMSQVFMEELKIPTPDHFLNIRSGSHAVQTARLLESLERVLIETKPDLVVVLGDTNSTLGSALVAAKLNIPVAHIEAGCRSFDLTMPEEINRLVTDSISSLLFAPTETTAQNLYFEGHPRERVFMCGNTIVDVVEEVLKRHKSDPPVSEEYVLLTMHRAENVDNPERLKSILTGIKNINTKVIFPAHPRTIKRIHEFGLDSFVKSISNLEIIEPLGYVSFVNYMLHSKIVLTDSGGVQEEVILLNRPCLTLRDTTEWPETVWAGGNVLVGWNSEKISELANRLLDDEAEYKRMANAKNPFKENAAKCIAQKVIELYHSNGLRRKKIDLRFAKYPLPHLYSNVSVDSQKVTLSFDENGKPLFDKIGKYYIRRD